VEKSALFFRQLGAFKMAKKLFAGAVMAIDLRAGGLAWCPYAVLAQDSQQAHDIGLRYAFEIYPSRDYGNWKCGLLEVSKDLIQQTL
jgi:hypothetical protein